MPAGSYHALNPLNTNDWKQALGGVLDQSQRAIRLHWGSRNDQLAHLLTLQRLDIHEGLCTGIEGHLTCLSPDSELPLHSLLGLPLSVQVVTDTGSLHLINALVTKVQAGQSDGSLASYQLSIGDALSILDKRINSRIFRGMHVPDILATILREWQQRSPVLAQALDFELLLQQEQYPAREQTRQADESDAAFIRRLCRREGIFWFCKPGMRTGAPGGPAALPMHTLVFCDDPMRLGPSPAARLRYHRDAATEQRDSITLWSTARSLQPGSIRRTSWDYKSGQLEEVSQQTLIDQGGSGNDLAQLLSDSFMDVPHAGDSRADYERLGRLRIQAHEQGAQSILGVSGVRNAQVGTWFELAEHPEVDQLAAEQRQFIITSLRHRAQNNLPKTLDERAQALFEASHWRFEQPWRHDSTADRHIANSVSTRYENTFTCVTRGLPLTPVYDPRIDLPRVHPTTALVVGPEGEEVHCDELGRIKVQLLGLQDEDHVHAHGAGTSASERDSAWVRTSSSWAGPGYGHDTLPRAGMEVLIDHLHGDPDKMFVAGVLHNGPNMPATFSHKGGLPGNRYLSGVKTKEIKGQRYNQLRFDDTAGQISSQLASEHGHSQLNLGYLTHPREEGQGQARGQGAELRSDAHVAIRSGRALLVSAWQRLGANQDQLAREECLSLMQECVQLFTSLSDYAAGHQGMAMHTQAQQDLSETIRNWPQDGAHDAGADPDAQAAIAITAPAGISLATPKSVTNHAGDNIDLVAQQHLQMTSGQRVNVHAGHGVFLFAHEEGLSAIANQGPVKVQSQAADTQIDSAQSIKLTAAGGQLSGMASEQVVFVTSGGAYLKLDGGNIEIGGPGSFTVKTASHSWMGAASMSTDLPHFEKAPLGREFKLVRASDGKELAGYQGEVRNAAGELLSSGATDDSGKLSPLKSERFEKLSIRFFKKDAP